MKWFFRDKLRMFALLGLVATGTSYLGNTHWILELSTHFRVQYLCFAIFCSAGLLMFRDWRWSRTALLALGLNASAILPWYIGQSHRKSEVNRVKLRVMLANVLTSNRDSRPLLDLIARESPDVVVLQEIDARWENDLLGLNEPYPYSRTVPREDNFGIGIWSRYPLGDVEVLSGEAEVPSLCARATVADRSILIFATHPLPPASSSGARLRNDQLAMIAKLAREETGLVTVLGDLNVTMWSPICAKFERESGLTNVRRGFGVLPSWPTQFPILGIPLDHCFVSPAVQVTGARTGEPIGSDHLPLIVDLALP